MAVRESIVPPAWLSSGVRDGGDSSATESSASSSQNLSEDRFRHQAYRCPQSSTSDRVHRTASGEVSPHVPLSVVEATAVLLCRISTSRRQCCYRGKSGVYRKLTRRVCTDVISSQATLKVSFRTLRLSCHSASFALSDSRRLDSLLIQFCLASICFAVFFGPLSFLWSFSSSVILNWPERIKTQPHDERDNCFLPFDSKGHLRYDRNNDIDDDSATNTSHP